MEAPLQPAGIGWRHAHERALLEQLPSLGFIEVHSENFYGDGGAALALLHAARRHYDVSLHGVGLGLGSAAGLDSWHLDRLAALVERVQPVRVSDHACFARVALNDEAAPVHGSDLLPIAWTESSLALMVRHVDHVQQRLKRTILVENLASYLRWTDADYGEPEFFNALTRRSGCGLLLDVNNLVVNALNQHRDGVVARCCAWIDRIDAAAVGEIHLAGHDASGPVVIDHHGARVADAVWAVYRHALARFGSRPTLIEWDTDLPAFDVLLAEARKADAVAAQVAESRSWAAVAGSLL